jgi:erythromycin esterase
LAALPPISSIAPAAAPDDYSDLAPFAEAIAAARIVALGEQTHGGREEFQLKLRLLKFLHEKLGFEVLLLESGFYDIARLAERMATGEQLDTMAPGNVFFMYANSAEGREMLRYLDAQQSAGTPLGLAGIDSQHSGALSQSELLPRLRAFLHQRGSVLAEEQAWLDFSTPVQPLLSFQPQIPDPAVQLAFVRQAGALRAELCGQPPANPAKALPAEWWCQVVKSLAAQASSVWSEGLNYQRDNQMGDNAVWLMERMFAGKKAVIWAHTIHVAKGFKRSEAQLQAGEAMHRHWGKAYKVVQFTAAGGNVLDFGSLQPLALPPLPPASLEQGLAALPGGKLLVLPLMQRTVTVPQWSIDYQALPQGQLGRNWDVLFFLDRVHPVTMTR